MSKFTFRNQIASFEDYMDSYLKNKSEDCILYSEDGGKFKVHKEMFGQTQFLREILSSANERCCGTIEVFCPCSKDELSHLVNFLYDGEIHCEQEFDSLKILENLNKIFGFSKNLVIKRPNDPISEVFPILSVTEPVAITEEAFENISSEKPYKCQYCVKEFRKKKQLRKHELIHNGEKPYSCTYCSKTFSRKTHLKRHEMIHTGEISYSCKTCYKGFNDASNLKRHEMIHTGEKPYSCTYCSKTFSRKTHLKRHEMIHTGEKPYSCKTCYKGFNQLESLKRHERIHTGEKPYACKTCNKCFNDLSTMKKHEIIHTGEKPYACKTCNKCFSDARNLKRHEAIHTGKK